MPVFEGVKALDGTRCLESPHAKKLAMREDLGVADAPYKMLLYLHVSALMRVLQAQWFLSVAVAQGNASPLSNVSTATTSTASDATAACHTLAPAPFSTSSASSTASALSLCTCASSSPGFDLVDCLQDRAPRSAGPRGKEHLRRSTTSAACSSRRALARRVRAVQISQALIVVKGRRVCQATIVLNGCYLQAVDLFERRHRNLSQ